MLLVSTFEEAITWLRLTEDQIGLTETLAGLDALEQGTRQGIARLTTMGWVKSHVVLAEGKVYCEFESPNSTTQTVNRWQGHLFFLML